MSYGERLSSKIVATLIRGAKWFDSRNFIKTERKNGKGKHVLDSELTNKLVKEAFAEIPRIFSFRVLSVVTRTQTAPPTLAVAVATTQQPS